MPLVRYAVIRRVKPGREQDFEASVREFAADSRDAPGVADVHLVGPISEESPQEYGILRTFQTHAAADAFYDSPRFAEWSARVAALVEGPYERRELTGLEAFFRGPGPPPKRWRMAIVTWLGVYPSVLFWSWLLGPRLGWAHWLLAAAIVNAAVVATLTWIVMPRLTRILKSWIHKQ